MNCKSARADLPLACYGELRPPLATALTAHLSACPECAAESRRLDALLQAVTPARVFPEEPDFDWTLPVTCWGTRRELSALLADGMGEAREMDDTRRADLLQHLARCAECSAESATISETLSVVRGALPEEDRVDWERFARHTAALATGRDSRTAGRRTGWSGPARRVLPLAAGLAAAAVLTWMAVRPLPPESGPSTPEPFVATVVSRQQVQRMELELARSDAARYLADSRNVLLSFAELSLPCEGENVDVSVERDVSARLLRRKQYMEKGLEDVEIARAQRLADEVEVLLTEIASLEKCIAPERMTEIREMVRRKQLMMRIEILTNELRLPGGRRA